jgi:membrane-bound lytic murein transglycosylase D
MKNFVGILVVIFLIALNVNAQSAGDPFADLLQDLMRTAKRETDAVAAQPTSAAEANQSQFIPREDAPLANSGDRGLVKLRELKPLLGKIFEAHGVPQEFLLVGLVESGYRTDAVSPADAVGMWQFVDPTARRFGLIDDTGDSRTDLIRSTHAAAAYLKSLLTQYGDWRLALAAYSAGEDRLDRAIAAAGSTDFSKIARQHLLPEETLNYVPVVLRRMVEARSVGLIEPGKE